MKTLWHRRNIVFVLEIGNEWNKIIFGYRNQCASGWQIYVNRWYQREYGYKLKQHCWMLHDASVCTPCCMLFRAIGSCCIRSHTRDSPSTLVVILVRVESGSLSSWRPNNWKAIQPLSNQSSSSCLTSSKWNTWEWLNSGSRVALTTLVEVNSVSLNGLYLMYRPLLNLASWTIALRMVTCNDT